MAAHGLISSRRWFRLLGRVRGVDRRLRAGVYDIPREGDSWEILSVLASGRVATVRFTAPEGLTLRELAQLAQERLGLPADSVLAAARDSELRARFHVAAPTAEGYLLPETYQLPLPVSASDLVRAMLEQLDRQWRPEWNQRLDSLGWSRAQVLTLASIVEGEARHDDERFLIAGVYANRLRRGMALEADPTVQYAIEQRTGHRKQRLYFKDYDTVSPYNTYLHAGLPPGPVNSPGIASIEAALHPADVPYLYFVAGPDGRHVFSRTMSEHAEAIRKLRGR
jgi:UPF0755 protein